MLSILPKNLVETYLGYWQEGKIYLDLFLYNAETLQDSPSFSQFTKFTALYDQNYSRNILLNKKQLERLGICLKGFVFDSRYGKYKGSDILSGHVVLDCVVPILKTSKLDVYKYYQPYSSIEVFETEASTISGEESIIIIGKSFLERFLLDFSNKMADIMGLGGKIIFTKSLASDELELWDRDVEDLGLNQALKSCGKALTIGNHVSNNFDAHADLLDSPGGIRTEIIEIRDVLGISKKFEEANSNETSSSRNNENKKLSKAQQKRLKAKQSKEKIVKAQCSVSLEIKRYIRSEGNRNKVERLTNLLLQLVSSNTTTIQKQELITHHFEETHNGELQIKENLYG